jgi:hypothetical protein
MSRRAAIALAGLLAACGPAAEPAKPAPSPSAGPAASASASAQAASSAGASPAGDASAAADASAAPSAPSAAGERGRPKRQRPVLRFWAWDGPADGPAITGKRAWTAIAEGAATDRDRRVFVSVEDFAKVDGKNNLFTAPFGDIVSPVALAANLAPPAKLGAGDPVFAENDSDSSFGRVTKVSGDTVTMSYAFGELESELDAPKAEVVLVDGTLKLGAPVAFKAGGKWSAGRFLAKTADEAWVAPHWVDNDPVVRLKLADVRAIDAAKALKVGDACVCAGPAQKGELLPGKVTKAGGVFYEVKLDGGGTVKVPFDRISAPLK